MVVAVTISPSIMTADMTAEIAESDFMNGSGLLRYVDRSCDCDPVLSGKKNNRRGCKRNARVFFTSLRVPLRSLRLNSLFGSDMFRSKQCQYSEVS